MWRIQLQITLKQPLIISRQAASVGAHQSLDYIPGSVLLGLAASRLYAELDSASAWMIFHSGRVRFGDALPCTSEGEVSYPVPLCWHTYKGESAVDKTKHVWSDHLFNLTHCSQLDPNRQPVQVRQGYVSKYGDYCSPVFVQTLKTAIDSNTGVAAESQLFGYQALNAHQQFISTLEADAGLDAHLWDRLLQCLLGTAALGRSRSAQFGQVEIAQHGVTPPHSVPPNAGCQLTLWLISDLLLERHGQPCLFPYPELLGLPENSRLIDSFMRSRRYSVYNTYRRHYDSELQVISRGSVLCYQLSEPLAEDQLQSLQNGLGLQIEAGLGAALVNPPLLKSWKPSFATKPMSWQAESMEKPKPAAQPEKSCSDAQTASQAGGTQPDTLLLRVLKARQQRSMGLQDASSHAKPIFDSVCLWLEQAHVYIALPEQVAQQAPKRSQWGLLKQLANDHRNDPQQLLSALKEQLRPASSPTNKPAASGWDLRYGTQSTEVLGHTLYQYLEKLYQSTPQLLIPVVGILASYGLQPEWLERCNGTYKQQKELSA